ncbi:hypothetical protein [Conexibacter woesei]|uniref:hypothetical protein n=1 Tax=Conexibacter woesei TaxID=191495 RepID=UPI00047BB959|nr:hypothetical protein [Conexibacter woesei]
MALVLPAAALAAPDGDAQVRGTVKAYLGAVRLRDAPRICALLGHPGARCAGDVANQLAPLHGAPRVESVAAAGSRGRAVVDYAAYEGVSDGGVYRRTRLVLRRRGGHWRIVATATLPGTAFFTTLPDPAPRGGGTRARLARLVDDVQLGLSGDPVLACSVLAHRPVPSAFACGTLVSDHAVVGPRAAARWGRLRSFTLSAGGTRARIAAAVTTSAVARPRSGSFARRTTTRTETLFAQRERGGAWRLVKAPASFYAALGVPAPADVATPDPGATWPQPEAAVPSLSETPVPAVCAVPPLLWPGVRTCAHAMQLVGATLPDGRGVVAWSDGRTIRTRAVGAGIAAAPIAALPVMAGRQDIWDVGLAPTGTGALAIESGFDARGWSARATPLDGAGPAQTTDGPRADSVQLVPVAQAPGTAGAALAIGAGSRIERLTATGTRAAPDVNVPGAEDLGQDTRLARLPDGTYLQVTSAYEYGGDRLVLTRLGADGRARGTARAIAPAAAGFGVTADPPALAVDVAGQVLIVWREDDGRGHQVVRGWTGDPDQPAAEPVAIASRSYTPTSMADEPAAEIGIDAVGVLGLAAAALPGDRGWAVAVGTAQDATGAGVEAGRLTPAGTLTTPLRAITTNYGPNDDGTPGFALAGDTVAWIAPPQIAGLPQVRSAPLP